MNNKLEIMQRAIADLKRIDGYLARGRRDLATDTLHDAAESVAAMRGRDSRQTRALRGEFQAEYHKWYLVL